jgi:hypothetical protein
MARCTGYWHESGTARWKASDAREARHICPKKFINTEGNDATKTFVEHAEAIVGDLTKIGRLKVVPVKNDGTERCGR